MALLIDVRQPEWMTDADLRDRLAPSLPGVTIHCGAPEVALDDVTMLATSSIRPGICAKLPNLQLVQKLGAGVERIVGDPDLPPHARVARLRADEAASEIAEYCLAYTLRHQRNMPAHETDQAARRWRPIAPRATSATVVAVLGLGFIGRRVAEVHAALGFEVLGWSRSPKSIDGVMCSAGLETLPELLRRADYVASILPSTPDTEGLFDAARFAQMKPGAILMNAGRGTLVDDAALLAALDPAAGGQLGGAVLDVFHDEPLPEDHPFWAHPRVTVTPHVSGWRIDGSLSDVAENYTRLTTGAPLLNEVDRAVGY